MTAERLSALLDAERRAILDADYDRIDALSGEKARLLGRIGRESPVTLRRLAAQVGRNQRLLLAAREGLRDGASRLGSIRAGTGFRAYGRDGSRSDIAGDTVTFERRA